MRYVLVTNYENEIFSLVKRALQDSYEVISLPKNDELMDYLSCNPADIFLLTVSSKDTDSDRTYNIIKEIPEISEKPVIFLAKQRDQEQELRVIKLGAADYIALPISEELLLHRVNNCLELVDLRKEKPYVDKYQDAISFSFAELVECRDETTGGHLKNTTKYFDILLHAAIESGQYKEEIAPEDVGILHRSATLHDIGKIGITDDVLRKASSLNYREFEHMKTHTTLGKQAFEKIIKETGGSRWLYLAMDMAYCHHERWDGSGYPNGLRGIQIPLYARMLTIADVYDALTSDRVYKKAYSHEKAMKIIMEGRGSIFDPALVDLLIKTNKQFEETLLSKNSYDT